MHRIYHEQNQPKFAQFIANSRVTGSNTITMHTVIAEDTLLPSVPTSPDDIIMDSPTATAISLERNALWQSDRLRARDEDPEIEKIVEIDTTGVSTMEWQKQSISLILLDRAKMACSMEGLHRRI